MTNPLSSTEIIAHTAAAFGVSREDLAGPSKVPALCRARYAACLLLREKGLSLSAIGARLGKRDHSTILTAVRRAQALLQEDRDFVARFADARAHQFAVLSFKSRRKGVVA